MYIPRVVQKVCRVTRLITRYVRYILSLFNMLPCKWSALGPVFLQLGFHCRSCSFSQQFAMQMMSLSSGCLYPFMNSFSLGNKLKLLGAKSKKYDGWWSSSNLAFPVAASFWDDVRAGALSWWSITPRHSFPCLFSFNVARTFLMKIVVGSCDSVAMFKIVCQYSYLRIQSP